MLPLNPTCVSFSHHPHQSPLCFSGFPLKHQWAKGSRHGGNFTTTCSTLHFPGQQCRWMAFRRSLQGHSWSIICRSPIWLCQKQKPRNVMKNVTRPVRNSTLTGKFQGSQKINCNIWLYYHVLRLFLDRRRLVPVLRLQRALTKHRDVCHTPVFQTATLRNRGCQISPCDCKKEKWSFGYILKVPLDKYFKWCYPGKASLNKMDTILGFLNFFFFFLPDFAIRKFSHFAVYYSYIFLNLLFFFSSSNSSSRSSYVHSFCMINYEFQQFINFLKY